MWQSHKIMWYSCTGKLEDICGSPHMEKEREIHPEERNMVQRFYNISIVTNKYK